MYKCHFNIITPSDKRSVSNWEVLNPLVSTLVSFLLSTWHILHTDITIIAQISRKVVLNVYVFESLRFPSS